MPVPVTKHRSRNIDFKSQVRKYENLKEPEREYDFSKKTFYRKVDSKTGIYAP